MKPEIVILTRSLPLHCLGGMEVVAWDLSREFARLGRRVRVITTALPGYSGAFELDNVTVVPLEAAPSGRYSSAWWAASRRYFEQNCMASTAAVLSVSIAASGLLPLRPALPGVPFFFQAHGTSWGEVVSKWRSRRPRSIASSLRNLAWLPKDLVTYRRFDGVIAIGKGVYRDLTTPPASWVLARQRVHLINNGIDTELFRPSSEVRQLKRKSLGLGADVPMVISASRLHAQKGVALAIQAFAELRKQMPDAVFLIAGDGPERSRLESLSRDLGLEGHVRFLGAITRPELADYLRAADVFLFLTQRIEGLPLNVLEALASGLPVVVSRHVTLFESPELYPVPPRSFDAVVSRLGNLLAGRTIVRRNALPETYWLSISAQRYLDLFASSSHEWSGKNPYEARNG